MVELKIDKEFAEVLPTSEERYKALEETVLKDGMFTDPFITWNGYIIDGHTRYRIMQNHPEVDLKPREVKMDDKFADRYAVIVWIGTHQMNRRNLNEFELGELSKKMFDAEKKSVGAQVGHDFHGNQHTESLLVESDQTAKAKRDGTTATALAYKFGMSVGQFKHSVRIGNAMEEAERLVPGAKDAIKSGKTGASKSTVEDLLSVDDEEERKEYVKAIVAGEKPKAENRHYATKETRDRYNAIREIAEKMGGKSNGTTFDDVLRILNSMEEDFIAKVERLIEREREKLTGDERWQEAIEGYFDSVIYDINNLKGRII